MVKIRDKWEENKKWLCFVLIVTFIWGMAAHGYGFLHSSFSHDSLLEFNGELLGNHYKFMTGRFLSPVNRAIFRTSITMPWLIGVLSLLWIGLAVFLTLKIFNIESKVLAVLIAGIYTINLAVSTTAATFIHDLDSDMLALLFSVLAVYVWKRKRWGWLLGALCVMASLAFYQSYITVTIVLVMFVCILDVLNEEKFKTVFANGMKAIGMLLLGGCLYYIGMQAALKLSGYEMMTGKYNTLDKPLEMTPFLFEYFLKETYYKLFKRIANVLSPYPAVLVNGIAAAMFLVVIAALVVGLWNKRIPILQKLLCALLVALLPLAMNLMHLLTLGNSHELMQFAYWLFYLLVLLLADWLVKWLKRKHFKFADRKVELLKLPQVVCMALVFVMLYSNVQVANVFYLKKDLEQEGYLSLMTRVVYRMEDYEGYEPGVTPVVMIGLSDQFNRVIPGFEDYTKPNGVQVSDVMTVMGKERCETYFGYILNNPAVFAEQEVWDAMETDERVAEMPCYPEHGCVDMIDGVLVVKLGEIE